MTHRKIKPWARMASCLPLYWRARYREWRCYGRMGGHAFGLTLTPCQGRRADSKTYCGCAGAHPTFPRSNEGLNVEAARCVHRVTVEVT